MIGNISPSVNSTDTTFNTLWYADWVKEIKSGGSKKGDDLMLGRDKKKQTTIEYDKPTNDSHLIFEEYWSVPNKT